MKVSFSLENLRKEAFISALISAMNRKEPIVDSEFYHVYNRGNNQQSIFRNGSDYAFFLRRLAQLSVRYSVRIVVYCLMPNHYHMILQQEPGGTLSKMMGALATATAKRFNLKYSRVGHLYQGPYHYKCVASNEYLIHLARYIHSNPLIAGLVQKLTEWKWSNYGMFNDEGFLQPGLTKEEGSLLLSRCSLDPILRSFGNSKGRYRSFVDDYTSEQLRIISEFLDELSV